MAVSDRALLEVQLYFFSHLTAVKKGQSEQYVHALGELCASEAFADSIELTTKSVGRFHTRFTMFGQLVERVFGRSIKLPSIA